MSDTAATTTTALQIGCAAARAAGRDGCRFEVQAMHCAWAAVREHLGVREIPDELVAHTPRLLSAHAAGRREYLRGLRARLDAETLDADPPSSEEYGRRWLAARGEQYEEVMWPDYWLRWSR